VHADRRLGIANPGAVGQHLPRALSDRRCGQRVAGLWDDQRGSGRVGVHEGRPRRRRRRRDPGRAGPRHRPRVRRPVHRQVGVSERRFSSGHHVDISPPQVLICRNSRPIPHFHSVDSALERFPRKSQTGCALPVRRRDDGGNAGQHRTAKTPATATRWPASSRRSPPMFRAIRNLVSKPRTAARRPRTQLGVDRLPDRINPVITDMTGMSNYFPTHDGPTTLYLSFDGGDNLYGHSVAPFSGSTKDKADILYRVSEEFAPFNVQVRQDFGFGNYGGGNGSTTVFVGDDRGFDQTLTRPDGSLIGVLNQKGAI